MNRRELLKRRDFITLLGGATAVWPLAARTQQVAMPSIGFLRPLPPTAYPETLSAFRQGLGDLGYTEGRNVIIEHRWSAHYEQLSALAAELVERGVSVIFTGGGAVSTLAAKAATKVIPIVFVAGDDPIRAGIVTSLNRPEGNITGITLFAFTLEMKKLELLTELAPQAKAIAILRNPNAPEAESQATAIKTAAADLGRQPHLLNATTETEIDAAFVEMAKQNAGALLVVNDVYFSVRSPQIIALAKQHSIPAIFDFRHHVIAGGLVSYGSSLTGAYHQAGIYTGRVLKARSPASFR
jgi:putative ABC transport system substrate-binding protein